MLRPYVTVHFAQSLDGHIDRPGAERQLALSEAEGFALAHQVRASHDAVLVGVRTVLRDNPRLLVSRVTGKHPHRVVLDSDARLPLDAHLLTAQPETRVLVLGTRNATPARVWALQQRGAEVTLFAPTAENQVPIAAALSHLFSLGIRRLLVEGGATVIQSFLRARCVDRMQVEVAPIVVGSGGLPGLGTIKHGFHLEQVTVETLGNHALFCGTPYFTNPLEVQEQTELSGAPGPQHAELPGEARLGAPGSAE
jgi:riboflavin-specific deaminase-like protein